MYLVMYFFQFFLSIYISINLYLCIYSYIFLHTYTYVLIYTYVYLFSNFIDSNSERGFHQNNSESLHGVVKNDSRCQRNTYFQ